MAESEHDAIPADLETFYAAERGTSALGEAVRDRMWAGLETRLDDPGGGGERGGEGGGDGDGGSGLGSTAGAASVGAGVSWGVAGGLALATFVAGTMVGVWVGVGLSPEPEPGHSLRELPSAPPATPPHAAVSSLDAGLATVVTSEGNGGEDELERTGGGEAPVPTGRSVAHRPTGLATPAASTAEPGRDLAAERRILDAARGALARGHFGEALTVLERHLRAFPTGALAEERDALRVRALSEAGRDEDAYRAAAMFRTAYPQSVFRGMVDRFAPP